MIKDLKFIYVTQRAVISTPAKVEKHMELDGSVHEVVREWDVKKDMTQYSVLPVLAEDVRHYVSALNWACHNDISEVYFPSTTEDDGKVKHVELSHGRFTHALNENEIHEIVQDFLLLHGHFNHLRDVLAFKLEGQTLETLIFYLLDKAQGDKEAKLEPWLQRALEIRRQHKQGQ